jgi:hypothetical protein
MGACRLQTGAKARRQSCIGTEPHVCFVGVCRRHVPLPVQANQGTKALLRAVKKPHTNKPRAIKNIAARALFPCATSRNAHKKGSETAFQSPSENSKNYLHSVAAKSSNRLISAARSASPMISRSPLALVVAMRVPEVRLALDFLIRSQLSAF